MKSNIHFRSYLAHFFLEWKMFQTKVVEKLETHILCTIIFFFFENSGAYDLINPHYFQKKRAGSGRNCSQAVSKPVWHIPLLCVQWKTPDDGQRNCLKHVEFYSNNKFEVEFYSNNKFEKLVHLVGFIIWSYQVNFYGNFPLRTRQRMCLF